MKGRVLVIAGSDSGGGAGLQADIKTITALGAYAATAVTAVTVQNTMGVHNVHVIPADIIEAQIATVLEDIGADMIKIGMLGTAETIAAVFGALKASAVKIPVVLDPVMVATSGDRLLEESAITHLKADLFPMAEIVTPNVLEAAEILGRDVGTAEEMMAAAEEIRTLGPQAVLVTGGDLEGSVLFDVLSDQDGVSLFKSERIDTTSTHGTGCTLSSAIAASRAQGLNLRDSVDRARAFVRAAIAAAPGLGRGHGPLNHAITVGPFDA